MRSLLNALVLLPVAVYAAPFVPDDQVDQEWDRRGIKSLPEAQAFAHVQIDVPNKSPDVVPTTLDFQLEVLDTETPCGFGNVTVDGTVLPQTVDGDISRGKGSVSTITKGVVVASWEFHCIRVNGVPDAQLLKFTINYIDGMAMEDSGFSMLFRQSGTPEIVNIETDPTVPDEIAANPNPESLLPDHGNTHKHLGGIEEDLAELHYLWSQLRELTYLIHQKERSIAHHANQHYETDIKDCDSLKCVVNAMARKTKHAALGIYNKITGNEDEPRHGQHHADESSESFREQEGSNHTHHRNHTHHLPPWKRPHSRPLPICRYPPPPSYGSHQPGHHSPPPPPPPPQFDHLPSPPPPHHSRPPGHDRDHEGPPPPSAFYGLGPPPPGPPPHHLGPSHNAGHNFQVIKFTSIGFLFAFVLAALHRRVCAPARRADRHERRRRRRALRRAAHKHIITRLLVRMAGNDSDDEDDDEKRAALLEDAEDGMSTTMSEDIEQLRNAADVVGDMVEHVAVNGKDTAQVRPQTLSVSAATPTLVSEPVSIPVSDPIPLMQDFEEELPAYEDHDGSEMDSVISDGYRPGMLYTPSQSSEGSLSDVLGADIKS
ncbi:hypothetical protein ONS96_005456 [Cadophora gregata f. sp. sojae]|nr:hypothetical protein ONS96_005456 [Cadophora gregata f. sp. sojae]